MSPTERLIAAGRVMEYAAAELLDADRAFNVGELDDGEYASCFDQLRYALQGLRMAINACDTEGGSK